MSDGLSGLSDELWRKFGHSVFIHIDLDAIGDNIELLKKQTGKENIGVIAVIKSNAYGHGGVEVAKYLTSDEALVDRLAVATIPEAIQLRKSGIGPHIPIHLFGCVPGWAMVQCLMYSIIPTVANEQAIRGMANALDQLRSGKLEIANHYAPLINAFNDRKIRNPIPLGAVNIKIDTGMSRNGCQPQDLPKLIEACNSNGVPIDAIFSHFCNHGEVGCSEKQLEIFNNATKDYREAGYKFHMANSCGVLRGLGTDLDFIRPGISIYGMPPESVLDGFVDLGFRPALSVKGAPTLVKKCVQGTRIGYGLTYTCLEDQWIATFPIGYGDGFRRGLGAVKSYIVRDKTGEKCPIVGRVSMDAITVRVPCQVDPNEVFTIVSADYDPSTSVYGLAKSLDTIEYEILTSLAARLPRVYSTTTNPIYAITGSNCLAK